MMKKPKDAAKMKVKKISVIEPSAPHKIQGVAMAVQIRTVAPIRVGLGNFLGDCERLFLINTTTPVVSSKAAERIMDVWFCAVK